MAPARKQKPLLCLVSAKALPPDAKARHGGHARSGGRRARERGKKERGGGGGGGVLCGKSGGNAFTARQAVRAAQGQALCYALRPGWEGGVFTGGVSHLQDERGGEELGDRFHPEAERERERQQQFHRLSGKAGGRMGAGGGARRSGRER